ncbi:MAG: cytochrome c biogenesis protein CcsA [Verrucomicrobiota bacterium]|nr:cytochrome c biogenesis protein CcsA [Verrucomicrobiota bacterium]
MTDPAGTAVPPKSKQSRLESLASLRLTVLLLALSMVLVFFGTLAQVRHGIYWIQENYFRSFFLYWGPGGADWKIPIFPGGYLVGLLLFINLSAAYWFRFRFTRRKFGILMVHAGLMLLLLGELFTALFSQESLMRIDEGASANYSEAQREVELALIDRSAPGQDLVTVVPQAMLRQEGQIELPDLPLDIRVKRYLPNSRLYLRSDRPDAPDTGADMGMGPSLAMEPWPKATRSDERDLVTALVEILHPDGSLGTWLVSNALAREQEFTFRDRTYSLALRSRRFYKPFTLHLLDFTHERYAGTDIPKDFSSRVRLVHPEAGEDREVLIYMNHPLRYGGFTFYQSGFDNDDQTTILQVVKNPSWLLPYVSCLMVTLGLIVQFGLSLIVFLRRRSARERSQLAAAASEHRRPTRLLGPLAAVVVLALALAAGMRPPAPASTGIELDGFAKLPVLLNGRIKPLDTIARNSLMLIHGKQRLAVEDGKIPAIAWLAEVLFLPGQADRQEVFLIHNPDILDELELSPTRKLFAFHELESHLEEIDQAAVIAGQVESQRRTLYQRDILRLQRQLSLYLRLQHSIDLPGTRDLAAEMAAMRTLIAEHFDRLHQQPEDLTADEEAALQRISGFVQELMRVSRTGYFYPIPAIPGAMPEGGDDWMKFADALMASVSLEAPFPPIENYIQLGAAFRAGDNAVFQSAIAEYNSWLAGNRPDATASGRREVAFNRISPFSTSMALYVIVFLIAVISWIKWPKQLTAAAFWLLIAAFLLHTGGLLMRMILEGRPPVTNLYSSAVFIGWGAVLMGLILERLFRNGIGSVTAAAMGFTTLIIAHHLSGDGDTMEMMRAVLDSNFWLATHVVVITFGYSATYLAGFLAIVYLLQTAFNRAFDPDTARSLERMTYGIICFAALFSFVGTILGGIWADQSWGRFWGWDPKENGALLIVIWNAIILHARWGGIVRGRGLMVLTVFGNIVTSWSWFGTNMLGVGLHSYGFMDSAFFWLAAFIASQLLLMCTAALPMARRRAAESSAAAET